MVSIQFDVCLQSFLTNKITPKPISWGQRRIYGWARVRTGPHRLTGGPPCQIRENNIIRQTKKLLKVLERFSIAGCDSRTPFVGFVVIG